MRPWLIALVALSGCTGHTTLTHQATPTTVVVVRHAEKAQLPDGDPDLIALGRQRSDTLAWMLSDSSPDAIYATQFQRTQQTVAPLAARYDMEVTIIDAGDIAGLADQIRRQHAGQIVVVAAHSNTVPDIIDALGAQPVPAITDDQYSNLYVLSLLPAGGGTTLRLHFPAISTSP